MLCSRGRKFSKMKKYYREKKFRDGFFFVLCCQINGADVIRCNKIQIKLKSLTRSLFLIDGNSI